MQREATLFTSAPAPRSTRNLPKVGCWQMVGLVGILMMVTGCQMTRPVGRPEPAARSFKPQTTGPVQTATGPRSPSVEAATATIRGQTPDNTSVNGWNTNSAGNSNTFRNPMPASDATQNRYVNSLNPQVGALPQPTVPAPAGARSSLPAANGNYGGAYLNPGVSPNTVLQPQLPGVGQAAPGYGYGVPSPSDYNAAIAPGAVQGPGIGGSPVAPGASMFDDPMAGVGVPGANGYRPRQRIAPIDVYVQEARTGRVIVGGSVNSDLGVAGQIVIDERNFNIRRFPKSWRRLWGDGTFRGGGQNFRAELMPGNRVERYTVSWTERNLLGYLPYSLSVGGFYFTRQFRDWTEQRLGGRVALGYEVTKDISVSSEIRMEDVKLFDPRLAGVQELDDALGSNDIYTARFRVAHDTRDSPFMSSRGSLLELVFDQVFGEYDYSRGNINYSKYFLVRERPDGTGRHTVASTWRLGITGSQTPVFENYFAGGYSTLRGFSFRGASPTVGDIQVGGELMFLGSLEYVFPITADEMLRGVAFVDYGTVEQDLDIDSENFRVAPGLGLRVSVPALGPAPLAFDFAYPLNHADTDDRQVFSFFMGFTR